MSHIWKLIPIFCLVLPLHINLAFGSSEVSSGNSNGTVTKPTRIVGGRLALKNEIPYIVAWASGTPPHRAFCGGVIIDALHILTAAHCFSEKANVLGSYFLAGSLNTRKWGKEGQVVKPTKIILHDGYDGSTLTNDIAIVELPAPLKFNEGVQPIAIPPQGLASSGAARVSGWGEIQSKKFLGPRGDTSDFLKTLELKIVPRNECLKYYRDIPTPKPKGESGADFLAKTHICAGVGPNYEVDTCNGDSGGPLVCSRKQGQKEEAYLCGIISGGKGCANKLPTKYTEVSQFHDWIITHSKGASTTKCKEYKLWGFAIHKC